jgi:hypothetical protein
MDRPVMDPPAAAAAVGDTGTAEIENQALYAAADGTLSMTSTATLESICVGTRAGFLLAGHTLAHRAEAERHLATVFGELEGVPRREKEIGGSGGSLEPLGLFLRTSIPFIWRILSAFLPA